MDGGVFSTEEVKHMSDIARHLAEQELARQAYAAKDKACLEAVRSELVRLAQEADEKLADRIDYLVRQKIKVPAPRHYAGRVATGPITRWTVANDLRVAGFDPTSVVVRLVKKLKFRSRDPYVIITFTKK